MPNLTQLVHGLLDRPGVEAVLLVSGDGLSIEQAAHNELNADAVAALAATLIRQLTQLGEAADRGPLTLAVLEYERGLFIQSRLHNGNWLLLLTEPDADVGELLYDLRQHQSALTALLQ